MLCPKHKDSIVRSDIEDCKDCKYTDEDFELTIEKEEVISTASIHDERTIEISGCVVVTIDGKWYEIDYNKYVKRK